MLVRFKNKLCKSRVHEYKDDPKPGQKKHFSRLFDCGGPQFTDLFIRPILLLKRRFLAKCIDRKQALLKGYNIG